MKKYFPQQFEQKWVDIWQKEKTYKTADLVDKKGKMYVLDMFPYPSGAGLHVGHPRGYTASDILARYYRMNGFSVLHPMGWDAFGLPAENAAIKAKKNPIDMVPLNIANFKRQMMMLGFSYDWDREFATTDPSYYKWTQWLFIQFYKMGLLYKKNTPINFCPFCKTGLAEEEVLPNGTHERCGTPITKKDLPQWIFRITLYGDRLLNELKDLDWPSGILEMQKNWIGRKEGINIRYPVSGIEYELECFTTRPETNFGATFIVLAPEHELIKKILSGEIKTDKITAEKVKEIRQYADQSKAKTELERQMEGRKKTGVFTGLYAVNRLNGKELPIWISDFVLAQFGTGAVVGVPAHDQRDFDFALEFGIEVVRVVIGSNGDTSPITRREQVYEDDGRVTNSDFLNGKETSEAVKVIIEHIEQKGWGKRVVTYHLRDWIFSRQRYWGEPIPMVYCQKCADQKISYWDKEILGSSKVNEKWIKDIKNSMYGWFPLKEDSLPLELPYVKSYEPTDTGESPLSQIKSFIDTTCPNCGGSAARESDTMPNWAGSCWYFLRFVDPQNTKNPWNPKMVRELFPVDWYIGGAEHAVLHLLYARFWVKALQDLKLLDKSEPFLRLRNVGMILAEDNRKMSKSLGNVINPDDVVKDFGADSLRTYEMFMAPFSQEITWSTRTLQGVYRFLGRIWNIYNQDKVFNLPENKELVSKLNKTIQKVTDDILHIKFNTAIASMMELINLWEDCLNKKKESMNKVNAKKFLQLLAPFAPFISEELWHEVIREDSSIHLSQWPKAESAAILESAIKLPVQVNGKVRTILTLHANETDKQIVIDKALADERVKRHIGNSQYEAIYVQNKIINFIIK